MEPKAAPHVLLVDDDLGHREALAEVLARAGYDLCLAADVREALVCFTGRPIDLVVTDLRMPGETGLDLLRLLRTFDRGVPVLVVTAHGEWKSYLAAMDGGAVDYLTKPVRREDILSGIQRALVCRGIRAPDGGGQGGTASCRPS